VLKLLVLLASCEKNPIETNHIFIIKTKMQEIAAYLLCKLAGKEGTSDEVTAVLAAAGKEADEGALSTLLSEIEGKDINELLAAGDEKLKTVKVGGGGGGGAGGGDAAEEAVEEEEEEEEEADIGGGMDMFGGGDDGDY